jgi:hypothetical protein
VIFATTFSLGTLQITGSILFAAICALLAASKGRSALAWGLGGFFLQCFGLLFVLLVSDTAETHAIEETGRRQNRRVNERIKKESSKLASLKSEMRGRLDAHDLAIGLDTRNIKRPLQRAVATAPPLANHSWYYEEDGQTAGPVSQRSLLALADSGLVLPATFVWREGMDDWQQLAEVDELS